MSGQPFTPGPYQAPDVGRLSDCLPFPGTSTISPGRPDGPNLLRKSPRPDHENDRALAAMIGFATLVGVGLWGAVFMILF
jgi:hypothetical protein